MTHIAIDLDDVLLDFCGGLVSVVNREYDANLVPDDINQWDLHQILDPIIGENWWKWMRRRNWLWATFPAIPGAIGALEQLRRAGHYLEILTSKPEWAEANTWQWLGKWKPPVQRVTVVGPDDQKPMFSDAAILVDDKKANIDAWVFSYDSRYGILFDRPHNQDPVQPHTRVDRAEGWGRVLPLVERYGKEVV